MAYSPPPGSAVVLPFSSAAYTPPPGDSLGVEFTPAATTPHILPLSFNEPGYGKPKLSIPIFVRPQGIASTAVVSGLAKLSYPLHQPDGIASTTVFGTAFVKNKAEFVRPVGIPARFNPVGVPYVHDPHYDWYTPPGGDLVLEFTTPYSPPPGGALVLEFHPHDDVARLLPLSFDATEFGRAFIWNALAPRPFGWDSLEMGQARLSVGIRPPGFEHLIFPTPHIGAPRHYARPYGWNSQEFGEHLASMRIRTIYGQGFRAIGWGETVVANQYNNPIQPPGFSDEDWGIPSLRLAMRRVYPHGTFDSMDFTPAPREEDRLLVKNAIGPDQFIKPDGFVATEMGGIPAIGYWLQIVHFPESTLSLPFTEWGTAQIRDRAQRVYVPWESYTQWGLPEFGHHDIVKPPGLAAGEFGTATVELGSVLLPEGWQSSRVNEPEIKSMRRYVVVAAWDEKLRSGDALVYNKRQYLYVYNGQDFDYVPYMSDYNVVQNRNRRLYPVGIDAPRITNLHGTILTGQQTLPGMGEQTQWGDAMIAYSVRRLYPTWRFAGFVDPYHYIHNYATRIYPAGFDSSKLGGLYPALHKVWFNAQTIAPRYIQTGPTFGLPFIAPRVRTLQQYNAVLGTAYGKPWISNWERTVVVAPYTVQYPFGTPVLRTYRIVIKPFSIAYNAYGRPYVRNVTPQLYPDPAVTAAYGQAWISHSPRRPEPEGIDSLGFGGHVVMFRDRKVYPTAIYQLAIPLPDVRQQIIQPIGNQWIYVDPIPDMGEPPAPNVHGQPYPEGWLSQKFGTASVTSGGLFPRWPIPDSQYGFGFPTVISYQTIAPFANYEEGADGSMSFYGKPAVSPHTIWARLDAPRQAKLNHPDSREFYELGLKDNPPVEEVPPWFGTPRIYTAAPNILLHYHGDGPDRQPDRTVGELFGEQLWISNWRRYVYPKGFVATKYGFPELPHGRILWVRPIEDEEAFGEHTLSTPKETTQWVHPEGIDPIGMFGQVGYHELQLFNRTVRLDGFDATVFGNNEPMVYHYPRGPKGAGGTDHAIFGAETWVSRSPRECPIEGWDSFEEGYTDGQFEQRMRVTKGPGHTPVSVGDALRMGTPSVAYGKHAPQYIGPFMIPPPEYCHPHMVEEV